MKLLKLTQRYNLVLFLVVLGLSSVLFFVIFRQQVRSNVDEVLFNRKNNLISYFRENGAVTIGAYVPLNDFMIRKTGYAASFPEDVYADTLIYEPTDRELDEYRKLTTWFSLGDNAYELTIVKSHLEANEVMTTIAVTLAGIFVLALLALVVVSRSLTRHLWQPFYDTLNHLRQFRIDKAPPSLSLTRISEFNALNESLQELSKKNLEVFHQQKQFIENAAHEMQTPLAVMQSKLELLISGESLTSKQAATVQSLIHNTQRLSKLNRSLLLLSRIENEQFIEITDIHVAGVIRRSLEYFEEKQQQLKLRKDLKLDEQMVIRCNAALAEILIVNLVKNAFVHNKAVGFVRIEASGSKLSVSNPGETPIPSENLYQRFYKRSSNPDSWGLGLSIIQQICALYRWKLDYSYEAGEHRFLIHFR